MSSAFFNGFADEMSKLAYSEPVDPLQQAAAQLHFRAGHVDPWSGKKPDLHRELAHAAQLYWGAQREMGAYPRAVSKPAPPQSVPSVTRGQGANPPTASPGGVVAAPRRKAQQSSMIAGVKSGMRIKR